MFDMLMFVMTLIGFILTAVGTISAVYAWYKDYRKDQKKREFKRPRHFWSLQMWSCESGYPLVIIIILI